MKITTFETAKVGDKVWCIKSGWGEIRRIVPSQTYPIHVYFQSGREAVYTISGRFGLDDITQALFWDKVVIEAPHKPLPKLEVDTKVIVWNSNVPKSKRHFSHFNESGKIMCFDNGKTSWTTEHTSTWSNWELAELQPLNENQ